MVIAAGEGRRRLLCAAVCRWMDFPAACKGQTNEIKESCRTRVWCCTAAAPRSAAGSLQRNFIYLHLRDTIYQRPQWHSAGRERIWERERERGGLCREAERVQKQDGEIEKRKWGWMSLCLWEQTGRTWKHRDPGSLPAHAKHSTLSIPANY